MAVYRISNKIKCPFFIPVGDDLSSPDDLMPVEYNVNALIRSLKKALTQKKKTNSTLWVLLWKTVSFSQSGTLFSLIMMFTQKIVPHRKRVPFSKTVP